jgi:tRNA U38,U39,U40 pseudouridine synthase TruA
MLHHEFKKDEGILILSPEGPLEAADFARVAAEAEPYIEENGKLHGLMVYAESFPGWSDFGAFISHLKFVRDHHRRIEKLAAVSDSSFLSIAPQIASHFVQAEVRHFPYHDREAALTWLREVNS